MQAPGRIRGIPENPETRRTPRQQRSRETVNALVEAAAQVFSREGLTATTNRIAARAGMSIGTLYQYFPDKEALLHAVAERHVRDADRMLTPVFARLRTEALSFDATIRAMVQALVDLHSDRPRLHALLHRIVPQSADQLEELRAFEDRICDEVAFHLKRCDRGGHDAELTAQTLVHTIDAQLHRVMARNSFDVESLVRTVNQLAPPRS